MALQNMYGCEVIIYEDNCKVIIYDNVNGFNVIIYETIVQQSRRILSKLIILLLDDKIISNKYIIYYQ